jgi:hypothetical protein
MPDENTPPENQDKAPEMIGGKFKSVDELWTAYQESERTRNQYAEENDRMTRFIGMMDQAPAKTQEYPQQQVSDYQSMPAEGTVDLKTIDAIVDRKIAERVSREKSAAAESKRLEDKFFTDHPDLREHEELVLFHTAKYKAELGGRPVSVEKMMADVAARTTAHIKQIREGDRVPPHLEGGSRGERLTGPKPTKEPNEAERLQDFIAEDRKQKLKQIGKG